LVSRSRQRFWKSRHARDRRKVRQLTGLHRIEDRARRDRLGAGLRPRRSPLRRARYRRRSASRKLREAESSEAERRATTARNRARQIVSRAARCADDHDFARWRTTLEEPARGLEPY